MTNKEKFLQLLHGTLDVNSSTPASNDKIVRVFLGFVDAVDKGFDEEFTEE